MKFRVHFLMFWVVVNIIYAFFVETYLDKYSNIARHDGKIIVNDGSLGFLEVFACIHAALAVGKFFFAFLYIIKFKILSYSKKY